MPRTYQQFIQQLSTPQLELLNIGKRAELEFGANTRSNAWKHERERELGIIVRELRMRGVQLRLLD